MREVTLREMESWPVGEPFALRPHTQRITLAVIMRAVFGVNDEDRLDRFGRLIEKFSRRVNAVIAFPMLRRNLGRFSPWGRFIRARRGLDDFIYEEIALRRAEVESGEEGHDDVLSLLLAARHDDGSPMSDEELRDELVTVLGAGPRDDRDRPGLGDGAPAAHPAVLERLRESIAAGEDDYLDATIKETLRARPVIVDVARKLTAPLSIAGFELPAGTYVLPAIAALHYRDDLFPDPERVPARAVPRGQGRQLRLDPLRWRRPPLHRRRLRRIRDADRAAGLRRKGRPERSRPRAGAGQGPQHHPRPGQGHTRPARPAAAARGSVGSAMDQRSSTRPR